MKKQFILGAVLGGLICGSVGVFAGQYVVSDNPFPVKFNGENVLIEGYNIDGSTYFKLRDVADIVGGFSVDFKDDTILLDTISQTAVEDNIAENEIIGENASSEFVSLGDIVPYELFKWCPDFGIYTNVGKGSLNEYGNGYDYAVAPVGSMNKYDELLIELGFQKGKIDDSTVTAFRSGDFLILTLSYNYENFESDHVLISEGNSNILSKFIPD